MQPSTAGRLWERGILLFPWVAARYYAQVCECYHMGDKSPKTKNKQAAQKQAKASAAAKQNNANKAAKQVVKPKR